jgi:FkbM family methyltransferase
MPSSARRNAFRSALRLIPSGTILPILSGPNRGFRWTVGSAAHGCWIGNYERRHATVLNSVAKPGMTVFDVGANVGYFTLLFSRAVGPQGHVYAFEPNPDNLARLHSHLALNACTNVTVIAAAASDRDGEAGFDGDGCEGHLSNTGVLAVRTIRLDDFPTPDLIKMDIEGGEALAVPGAQRILSERRTIWFLALHYTESMMWRFESENYHLLALSHAHVLATPNWV